MAIKKSDLYRSLWESCDELRGGMDASQYKDYILVLMFVKYVSDKAKADPDSIIQVPEGASFDDLLALAGTKDVGEGTNKVIAKLAEANDLTKVIDLANFDDEDKLGKGKELQDRVSKLIRIFSDLDFGGSRAEGDDLLGDAYEYLMRHFATESGKSKGQFYTPAEVSRVLAKLLGIGPTTRRDQTAYDPTCGSGSLLLKVADEAPRGLTLYGQEKDTPTWALAKMNMVLHGNEDATLLPGDTIANPRFVKDGKLVTFDYATANPPFSSKSWSNGLENEYGRFEYGRPPEKNGDYAFLLHVLASLKSTGKGAVILPHGVLFRGNAEGRIRKELVQRGYIKAVIGLPPNLFYGTGIPACIVVLDKENAAARTGVLFIDASKGFVKDGAKNRLRNRDMHQIVDVFTNQLDVPGYSRMVLRSEIADPANDYNLNISRYIDTAGTEDLHDLDAHINGGIPNRDLDALAPYWDAAPSVRAQLFSEGRAGYSVAAVEPGAVANVLDQSPELQAFGHTVAQTLNEWFTSHRGALEGIDADTRPSELIEAVSENLLDRFRTLPLIEAYAVYEQLMTYWHTVMHDDVYMVMLDGWTTAAQPRPVRQVGTDKNGKPKFETPDLTVGANKLVMDLLPPILVLDRFLPTEKADLDALEQQLTSATDDLTTFIEEHAVEGGLAWEAVDDAGKVTAKSAAACLKEAKEADDGEVITNASELVRLIKDEAAAKKAVKEAKTALDEATIKRYAELTEADVKDLVIARKWAAELATRTTAEVESCLGLLGERLTQVTDRYRVTLDEAEVASAQASAEVRAHLRRLGVAK